MRDYWSFFSAEQWVFGRHSLRQIGGMVRHRGIRRVLVVTDQTLVSLGLVDRLLEPLSRSGIESIVFDGSEAEPSVEAAVKGYDFAKSEGAEAVIGLGGGSNMDLAKILAILLTHGGHPRDYFHFDRYTNSILNKHSVCLIHSAESLSHIDQIILWP